MLGDVHHPEAIRLEGVKGAVHEVVGRLAAVAACAAVAPTPIDTGHAGLGHESLDTLAAAVDALAEAQLGMHAGRAIGTPAHSVDVDDGVGQDRVVVVSVAAGLSEPRVEPGGRHLHHPAAHRHRQIRARSDDEGVGHFGRTFSRAK